VRYEITKHFLDRKRALGNGTDQADRIRWEDRDGNPELGVDSGNRSRLIVANPGARGARFMGLQTEQGGPHRNAFRTRPGGHRNGR
jgi:hypothetical protein